MDAARPAEAGALRELRHAELGAEAALSLAPVRNNAFGKLVALGLIGYSLYLIIDNLGAVARDIRSRLAGGPEKDRLGREVWFVYVVAAITVAVSCVVWFLLGHHRA